MSLYRVRLVLAVLCLHPVYSMPECLSICSCKWKNGKETVECVGADLVNVPSGLNTGAQVLDLSGNLLHTLKTKAFQKVGLVNLQKIYLTRCGLVTITSDAFYQVSNLVELDLSNNFLTTVPSAIFKDCQLLRKLQLSHNPIQVIENSTFVDLVQLTTLEMSHCQIDTIQPKAFVGLKNLEYLRLNGNKLRILSGKVVQSLPPLYALDLHQNLWYCDCGLLEVREWMINNNVPISIPPKCEQPQRVRYKTWDMLELEDFACPPEVMSVDTHLILSEGTNATLTCRVRAVPESEVHWVWRGRVITNLSLMSFGRQMYMIRETGTIHKRSTLTIMNVMVKDSGRYLCVAANRAGNVSVNVTLTVNARSEDSSGLAGGEIAGIVIGLFSVLTLLFVAVCFVVLQHRQAPSEERKNIGVKLYKNFDSLKQNQLEMTSLERQCGDGEDSEPQATPHGITGNSGYASEAGNSVQSEETYSACDIPERDFVRKAVYDDDLYLSRTREPSLFGDHRTWKFRRREGDGSSTSDYSAKNIQYVRNQSALYIATLPGRKDHYGDSHPQLLRAAMRTKSENEMFKEDNYLASSSISNQGTWKRSPIIPFHLSLSPEARDSPDEGLGDEKEYETDILD